MKTPGDGVDHKALAQFRRELRKFLAFSQNAAATAGLTEQQHQTLLAIRGLSEHDEMPVGELADILMLRPHSAGELVDRLVKLGLVERAVDAADGRRVLVRLSPAGEEKLVGLSAAHMQELAAIGPALTQMLRSFERTHQASGIVK